MNGSVQPSSHDTTSLSRKPWAAYVWMVVPPLLALALVLPGSWQHGWMTAVAHPVICASNRVCGLQWMICADCGFESR
jgi:hypothetical protein